MCYTSKTEYVSCNLKVDIKNFNVWGHRAIAEGAAKRMKHEDHMEYCKWWKSWKFSTSSIRGIVYYLQMHLAILVSARVAIMRAWRDKYSTFPSRRGANIFSIHVFQSSVLPCRSHTFVSEIKKYPAISKLTRNYTQIIVFSKFLNKRLRFHEGLYKISMASLYICIAIISQ